MKITQDIIYDSGNDLKLDTYAPDTKPKATLLLIHVVVVFVGIKKKKVS